MDERMVEERMDGWMNGWMNGRMDGWIDEQMVDSHHSFKLNKHYIINLITFEVVKSTLNIKTQI